MTVATGMLEIVQIVVVTEINNEQFQRFRSFRVIHIFRYSFTEACKKYLLEKDQEFIQKVINQLALKLNKESIDYILNKNCNGILFNFDNNELYLVKDCEDLLRTI